MITVIGATGTSGGNDTGFLEEWGVDVALTGPQKGLMLPPRLTILAAAE